MCGSMADIQSPTLRLGEERKKRKKEEELECGPMPNVMIALPNIGGVAPFLQRHKIWLTPTAGVPCSNEAKTRNPLKFAWVLQTTEPISATSWPKFTIHCDDMWGRYFCLTSFFPIVDMYRIWEDIVRQSCATVP